MPNINDRQQSSLKKEGTSQIINESLDSIDKIPVETEIKIKEIPFSVKASN